MAVATRSDGDGIHDKLDADTRQATARLGVGGLVLGYLLAAIFIGDIPAPAYVPALGIWLGYTLFAILWLTVVLVMPGHFPSRRLFGLSVDLAVPSVLLHLAPALMAPLYLLYLWVALDYGLDYGARYRVAALTGAALAFAAVIVTTPHGIGSRGLAWGWLVGLVALSLYIDQWQRGLHAARDQARHATALKSEFMAHLSHELRTPLHTILGACHLLPDPGPDPEQRRYLHLLRKTGEELEKEVTQALHWFRLEAGGGVRVDEPFDLYRALTDSVQQLLPQAEAKRLGLGLVIDPAVPCWVEGDAHRLHQVLTNLVANAVKFTTSGGVRITVRLLRRQGVTATIGIEVRDSGPGIADAARSTLLEPYHQADPSAERHHGGAGLGTAIVRQTVELLGGEVWFQSVPPLGTAFWLRLSLGVRAEADGSGQPHPPATRLRRVAVLALVRDPAAPWLDRLRQGGADRLTVRVLDADAASGTDGRPPALPGAGLVMVQAFSGCAALVARWRAHAAARSLGWLAVADGAPPPEPLGIPVVANADGDALDRARYARALWEDPDGDHETGALAASHRRGRLLVAEDNPPHQMILRTVLERAGYRVDLCDDGQAALERLQTTTYDAILLDTQMPRLDGLDTLRRYRATCARPVPVVMVSADSRPDTARRCLAAGARDFLTKPVQPEALLRTLALALGHPPPVSTAGPAIGDGPTANPHPPDFFEVLVGSFIRSSTYSLEDLRHAVATRDPEAYRRALHSLANSALAVGADELARLCAQSLAADEHDFPARAPARASIIRTACEEVKDALRAGRQLPAR